MSIFYLVLLVINLYVVRISGGVKNTHFMTPIAIGLCSLGLLIEITKG